MKKSTRTARKALSVFLCVLMMFSTWAVAVPGLASAADKYYVKVYVNIYDGSDGYGGAYSVEAATGKPKNYSWATSDGWYGRINMTGFTVFGVGGDYDAQDVSAELLEAEKLGTYYAMNDLSNDNANGDWDSKAIAKAEYTFTLNSFPVEIFWMNDENNWDGGNTGFAIRKLTVATSEGGTEHTMWEGLAGSDSETYNYYGSITPTGIHTCFEDGGNENISEYGFYKAITSSSQRAWSDPYSAGSYGTYYVNDYQSGGVSATFSEGVQSVAYNVDYINTGSTDTYHMNFINHSKTQSATIVGVNNSDKFLNNPEGTVLAPGAKQSFQLKNISSLGGDGGLANFCFKYTLDNVYASDALDASLAVFYQPCYIGTWNASDDSKAANAFQLANFGDFYITFQTNEGILETNSISGSNTAAASFTYTYYVDTNGMDSWEDTGLRFQMTETNYRRINFQNPSYTPGTLTLGGSIDNSGSATLRMADFVFSSLTDKAYTYSVSATGVHGVSVSPTWPDVSSDSKATLYNNNTAWCRFGGEIFKGSSTSTNPGTIVFNNMKFRDSGGYTATFSGTINVYAFDKSALSSYIRETLIDFAPMKERYNATAFSAYESALSNAMGVLANQKTTQYAVNQALSNLQTAVAALQTTDNLVNQIDSLTHIQYVDDVGSAEAASIAERYVLIPLGEHTVPQNTAYIGNGTYKNATNKNSNLTTNYTKDDTAIDVLNYYYWNIDYSEVDGKIAELGEAIANFDGAIFNNSFKTALENAKANLQAIDQTTIGNSTPSSQEEVDNYINAADDLLAHIAAGYEHCDYDANDDGADELKTKASTCSEAGYTYYKCNICGKIQKVADLELEYHQYKEESNGDYKIFQAEENHYNECEVCGYKLTYDHKFTYTSVDGEAFHTATCSDCGYSYEEGHSYGAWTKLDDTTHQRTCSLCPATETSEHAYGNWVKVDDNTHKRTCTEDGCDASETAVHAFTNPVLTRPALVDGAWTDGSYTYTCACGATKTEAAERADYSELENAVAELETLLNDDNLTADAEAEINEALEKAEKLADDLVTAEQSQINDLVKELQDVKADVEEAILVSKTTSPITEATSGIGVQFLKKTGVDTVESVQLGANGGFEAVRMRLSNHNSNLPITITKVTADKAYIGADDSAASNVFDTATVIAEAGTTDLYIVAPADFATAGNITYTIEYMVGNADEGYLKDADGNPVVFTTNAFLYVKEAAYTPYHYLHEQTGGIIIWQNADMAINYTLEATHGDFTVNNPHGAEKFNDNMAVNGASWVYTAYDYGDQCFDTTCTGEQGCTKKSDAHLATYNYYVDTSRAKTWEDAGFKARFDETYESKYNYVNLKYIRLAVNQEYLDGIAEGEKTFSVAFVPSASGTVGNTSLDFRSTGDLSIAFIEEPANDVLLFGAKAKGDTTNTVYANFSGTIPSGINYDGTAPAKLMFAPKLRMIDGGGADEGSYMTTHIWLTSYDKAELREAVNSAETAGYNPGYFDETKYEAYEDALANAKEVLGKAETSQKEIDEATAALNAAIADLTKAENEAKFVLTVTHSIHENADKNSTATGTEYDYYLVNGEVTPALNAAAIALDTINKYDDAVTLNVAADAAHTYNYWFIDYTGVKDAIDAAGAIINDTTTGYSNEYKQQVEDAKNDLQNILDGKDATTTPASQDDVTDAIDAVTALTGHTCDEAVVIPAKAPTCEEDGLTAGAKCSVCGKITKAQEVDPAITHNYDITNAKLVARPELVDGQWTTGKYEATCLNDASHKLPLAGVQRADYTAFDEAVAELKELATYENFTDTVKNAILAYAEKLENGEIIPLDYVADYTYNGVTIPGEQNKIDAAVVELTKEGGVIDTIENSKNDPKNIKPDFTAYDAEVKTYNEKTSTVNVWADDAKIVADAKAIVDAIKENTDATAYDSNATIEAQTAIIKAINEKYAPCVAGTHDYADATCTEAKICKICGATDGIANGHSWGGWELTTEPTAETDGTYTRSCSVCTATETKSVAREDYTDYDAAVERAENMLTDTTLTDAAKAEIQEALTKAEELPQNLPADVVEDGKTIIDNTSDKTIADATDALTGVLDKIANDTTGAYEKVDYKEYNVAVDAYDALDGVMTAEDKAAVEAIKAEIAEIPADGSKADYQTQVDKAAADIAAINAKYGDCANGNHTWGEPELTKKPTADEQGEYTETCGVCGATQITKVDLADYDAFNDAVKALETLLGTENLTDEAKAAIEEALDKAEALDKNLPADATTADGKEIEGGQDTIDALVTELNGVVADTKADIADGSALKPDYEAWEEAETAYDALDKTNVKSEIITEADALKSEITGKQADDTLTQATATQAEINAATTRLNEIIAGIEDGSLKDPDYSAVEDKLEEAKGNDGLNKDTQDKIDAIEEALEEIKTKAEPEANARDDQAAVDALEDQLDEILAGINDGTATAPDYTEWDAAEGEYNALDKTNAPAELVTEATNLKAAIDALKADETANAAEDQQTINAATARLNEIIDAINDVLTEKPDFSGYDASHDAYEELVEQYGDKIKDSVADDVAALDAIVDGVRNDEGATKVEDQDTIDDAKTALDAIIAGINDGSLKDPDYSAVEDKLEEAKGNDGLNKDTQDKIDAIEEALEAIKTKTEPEANARDDQAAVDALEDQLDEILAGINDGTATAPDYTEWDAAEGEYNALDKTNAPAELVTEATNLKAAIDALKADETANAAEDQQTINAATARLNEIIDAINDVLTEKPDFSGYDASHDAYEELVEQYGDKIKDSVADDVAALDVIVDGVRNDEGATKVEDQDAIDDAKTDLDAIIAGIEDGSLIKDADFTKVDKDLADAKNKAENNDVIDSVKKDIEDIEDALDELRNDPATNANDQDVIDALENELEDIIAGIEDGSLVKPDFTDADKDLADAKDKAENNDVIDGVNEKITELEAALDEIRTDGTATKADDQDDVDALEKELEDIIAGIEDGSLVKPDYTDAETAIENAENTGSLTDADKEALEELKDKLDEIKDDPASNKKDDQTAVDEIKKDVQDIINKYADCENGNHNWGAPELTKKPTAEEQGEYTEICGTCGATQITKVDLAEYDAFNDAVDALEALLGTENLTDEAKAAIEEALAKAEALDKNLPADVTTVDGKKIEGGQDTIDALVTELNGIVADTNAGIADGSLVKPDYTEVDKDLADAKDKAENNDVIDSVNKDIKDIEDKLNDLKEDPATNKAEHQDDVDALEKQLEDIIAGIEDGSLVKPDYTGAEEAIKEAEKDLDGGKLSEEDQKALDELKKQLDEIKKDPTSNKKDDQAAVDSIKDSVKDIINKYAECAKGNHDYETTTVAPTCTEKGYDIYTCKVCSHSYKGNYVLEKGHSEVILEAVEPTCSSTGLTEGVKCAECNTIIVAQNTVPALRHTDEDADGTCDVCGKGGLYDGCTCLCHNTHWFWRLVYIIFRIIWRVFKIHQVCPCGAVHY